jgi:hypothetical protein
MIQKTLDAAHSGSITHGPGMGLIERAMLVVCSIFMSRRQHIMNKYHGITSINVRILLRQGWDGTGETVYLAFVWALTRYIMCKSLVKIMQYPAC